MDGKRQKGRARQAEPAAGGGGVEALRERVRRDVADRGVGPEEVERVAEALVARLVADGAEAYPSWLEGIALVQSARGRDAPALEGVRRDLRQMERLMTGFSGELAKLDETLEVLAAYLRRMRTSAKAAPPDGGSTLH